MRRDMQIERLEVWPLAAEQQVLEIGAAAPIEADNLAIDHGVLRLDWVRTFLAQVRPLLECARYATQLAVMPIDVRQSARPVVLQLEAPVRVIGGFGQATSASDEWLGRHPLQLLSLAVRHIHCSVRPAETVNGENQARDLNVTVSRRRPEVHSRSAPARAIYGYG